MDPELQEMLDRIAELSTEELADLEARLVAQNEALGDEITTPEQLEELGQIVEAVEKVRAETSARAEAQAAREQQAAELRARLEPVAETPPAEPAETPAEPTEPETPAEPTAVVPDPAEPEVPAEPTAEKPEAIAAAAKPKPKVTVTPAGRARPVPGAAQVPQRNQPKLPDSRLPVITAAGDIEGMSAGQKFTSMRDVAIAIQKKNSAIGRGKGPEQRWPVATFHADYPEDRVLGGDPVRNMELIEAVTSPKAIIAAGGLCAPLAPLYGQAMISVADRPVRDALAQFRADRGGIRWVPPLTLTDTAGAITEWTVANDENPSNPATKACITVACDPEQTAEIEAIVRCLKFGNLGARTFPERVEAAVNLAMASHARRAEKLLLAGIDAASIAVTHAEGLGTTRDVLAVLDLAVAGARYRHRTQAEMPFRLIIPEWLDDNMRTDLAREVPGSTAERLATADAEINRFYAARNINVTRALDDVTEPGFAVQAVGSLHGWPTDAVLRLFPEGSHLFLDGGTLDLGVVRDSTLNSVNDYELFAETFERTAFTGVESLKITVGICPSGKSQAPATYDPCTSGS